MTRALAALPRLIALIVGGFYLWGLNPSRDPNAIPSVLISQPAPEFDLAPVDHVGVPGLSRADLTDNPAPVVVNVFASWCVPCRAEHAVLTRMVEQGGVRLMGINYKDKPEDARAWLAKKGYDPKFGARPLARLIQTEVRDPLTNEILFGRLEHGGTVRIGLTDDALRFEVDPRAQTNDSDDDE